MAKVLYPCVVKRWDGVMITAQNHAHHEELVNHKIEDDGEANPEPTPEPPLPVGKVVKRRATKAAAEPVAAGGERFMKIYPCACKAGPGPATMPDYCLDHGKPEETADCITVPYEELAPAPVIDEAGIFQP